MLNIYFSKSYLGSLNFFEDLCLVQMKSNTINPVKWPFSRRMKGTDNIQAKIMNGTLYAVAETSVWYSTANNVILNL